MTGTRGIYGDVWARGAAGGTSYEVGGWGDNREVGSCKLLPLSKSPISGPSDQGVHNTSPLCRQRNDKGGRPGLSPFCHGNHPIQAWSILMTQTLKQL